MSSENFTANFQENSSQYTAEEIVSVCSLLPKGYSTEWHDFILALFAQTKSRGWKMLLLVLPKRTLSKVLSDPNMDPSALAWCSVNANAYAREQIARNPSLPVSNLKRLAEDNDNIRMAVASNTNLPKHLFEKMSEDASKYVRMSLVLNPCISYSILRKLSRDDELIVRASVARRWNIEEVGGTAAYTRKKQVKFNLKIRIYKLTKRPKNLTKLSYV